MRIGIWCAYGQTLVPSEGIGVFAHNLAVALIGNCLVTDILMVVRAGDESLVADTVARGEGRITVAAVARRSMIDRLRRKLLVRRHRWLCEALGTEDTRPRRRPTPRSVRRLAVERRRVERRMIALANRRTISDATLGMDRDVWLLPHVSEDRVFAAPAVVVVHDMVPLRFPQMLKPHDQASFKRRCRSRLRTATLVGTMSEFIRSEDIVGLLGCPPQKVRVVRPAVPDDTNQPASRESVIARWPFLSHAYALYPAAFRPYKNHVRLVDAVARCGHRDGRPLDLVFTGPGPMPSALKEEICRRGFESRVRWIGLVDRDVLARLYCEAAVTVVPSLYEQGSFPVLEALRWGCPVAVSDIPALRESLREAHDAIVFFDPYSPSAIAAAIDRVLDGGAALRSRQLAAYQSLARRTWQDVATDWVTVFTEAITRHREDRA